MAIFPQKYFTKDNVLLRTGPPDLRETHASQPIAEKFAGPPKGVYTGFTPSAVGSILTLAPDGSEGYSLIKVHSDSDPAGLDIIVAGSIQIDFSSAAGSDFLPNGVQVIATANYTAGQPTTAQITPRPRQSPPQARAKDEVLICELTGTPGAIAVLAVPGTNRDVPLAFAGTDFGLMPAGSMESLAAAVDILNEVVAARTNLEAVVHTTLKGRLDTDLGAEAMAFRLGRTLRILASNDYQAPGGASEVTVSGSLSETSRNNLPLVSLNGGGSESVTGAVTDPTDTARNICFVADADTGDRLVSDETLREVIFGRLRQEPDFVLDGTLAFSNALTTVAGTNTKFLLQLAEGDTVQGPDGKFYEVASITSDAAATIKDAYLGLSASSGGLIRRRFKLRFRKFDAGAEVAHQLGSTTNVRFFFPVFVTIAQPDFSAPLTMHEPGERPAVPDATAAVPGKVALADAGSPYIGAINLQVGGTPVGGGPFHVLNFTGSTGSLIELAPGVIDVTNIGPQGPQGPGSGPGPPGPPGNPGPSVTHTNTFAPKPSADGLGPGPGSVNVSWTIDFGFQVRFLAGGIASIFVPAGDLFFASRDTCTLTGITLPNATTGTISATGGSGGAINASVILYLDAAGA